MVFLNSFLCIFYVIYSFAMPAMLFKSMVELRFNSVDWYFLLAIFISKSVVFLVVAILTLLLVRPTHTGKIGIYGIFSTQSHDFALGIPIGKLTFIPSVWTLYLTFHPPMYVNFKLYSLPKLYALLI